MADQSRPTAPTQHFTISYAGHNRPWAIWIAHQLERLGHETSVLRWDPMTGSSLSSELLDLLGSPDRVLLLLDNWYFRLGPRSDDEWNAALREVVPPHLERFAAVSVATKAIPSAVSLLQPVDLRDLDENEARRRVLRRLGLDSSLVPEPADSMMVPRFPNDPPEISSIPRRNDRFTGREETLDALHEQLAAGGSDGTRIALYGISGVGKSQIALEYAHRFGNDYDVVWWVNSNFRGTAREQLAALAARLKLSAGQEIGDQIRTVREALRVGRPYRRWLLIFDSADYLSEVEDLVPYGQGHVLLTTMTRDWGATDRTQEIEVRPFVRGESVAYVRRRAPRLTEHEADELAEAVQDLPLLLAQTAAWLDTNSMPAAEYVQQIRRAEPSQLGIRISDDYPMGFQTSWSITLNTLRERSPGAAELLKLFGFFSPDAIPVKLLQSARESDLPRHLASLAAEPIAWHSALRRLAESTAVRLEYQAHAGGEPAVDNVQMHRLYHGFLRNELPEEQRDSMSATACRILVTADPRLPSDTREWSRYAEIIPHLKHSGALESGDPAVRELVLNCLEYLRLRGEYSTGLVICQQVAGNWRKRLPATDRTMLVVVHQHANMLRRAGRYREAEAVGRTAVDLLSSRPADDPDLARAKDGLGGTLMALGHYPAAGDLFRQVAEAYAARLGEEAPRTLATRSNLGAALGMLGEYEQALQTFGEVLLSRERLLRQRNPLTLGSGISYSRMLRLLGRYAEASSRQELNLRLHRQVMDDHHPQLLSAEHNLALCHRRAGNLQGAEALFRNVVARLEQVQGSRHPSTLMVLADFATFTRQHGDLEEARRSAESVAADYERLVGPDHPNTVGTAGNVGLVMWEMGERGDALMYADRALHGMRTALGPDHPWTLGCALNAAGARQLAGDEEAAAELSRGTLARATVKLGPSHPLTLSSMAALADDLRSLRQGDEADRLEKEAIQFLTDTLGARHPHTLSVRRRERPYWDFEVAPI